jgi:predicted RNase H-like HicB family nuclease
MHGYIALIHPPENGSSWGAMFPDVPGCVSAGGSLEEALANAREALSSRLALSEAEGEAIPAPRSYEELKKDEDLADDFADAIVSVVVPRKVAVPKVRVNITIDPALLRETDEAAEAAGMGRSGFIEAVLRRVTAFDIAPLTRHAGTHAEGPTQGMRSHLKRDPAASGRVGKATSGSAKERSSKSRAKA